MLSYAAGQTSPHGPKGIASYPWDWLIDLKPINYLEVTVSSGASRTWTVHFLGLISPPMLLFAIPRSCSRCARAWRGRPRRRRGGGGVVPRDLAAVRRAEPVLAAHRATSTTW